MCHCSKFLVYACFGSVKHCLVTNVYIHVHVFVYVYMEHVLLHVCAPQPPMVYQGIAVLVVVVELIWSSS